MTGAESRQPRIPRIPPMLWKRATAGGTPIISHLPTAKVLVPAQAAHPKNVSALPAPESLAFEYPAISHSCYLVSQGVKVLGGHGNSMCFKVYR